MCGFTSGLATASVTEDPLERERAGEPGELVSKTEPWRHTVHR